MVLHITLSREKVLMIIPCDVCAGYCIQAQSTMQTFLKNLVIFYQSWCWLQKILIVGDFNIHVNMEKMH